MYHVKKVRWGFFLMSLLTLAALVIGSFWESANRKTCLGLPVEATLRHDGAIAKQDLDCGELFLFNGERAAVDTQSRTIYISQYIGSSTTAGNLAGKLELTVPEWELYFLEDSGFQDLKQAVATGHPFSVVVDQGDANHVYQVVFTTLPLLRLDGSTPGDSESLYGTLCLWNDGEELPSVSNVEFHRRGSSAKDHPKPSWKLSLKDGNWKKTNLSLLGLGSDNDWILNGMVFDDTKLREKFLTDLWNQIADGTDWNYPMASCEYVEVVYNGSYNGLYLLQRRVDKKYLHLSNDDILLKGYSVWEADRVQEAYAIKNASLPDEDVYLLLEDYFVSPETGIVQLADGSIGDLYNFADVNILIQFGSLIDNVGYKNMYYLLKREDGGFRLHWIPWDTDLGMGITYTTGFEYNYDMSMDSQYQRAEYNTMKAAYPELEDCLRSRWKQLRSNELSERNIQTLLEENYDQIIASGAWDRTNHTHGLEYAGLDTYAGLLRFTQERLETLDNYYS